MQPQNDWSEKDYGDEEERSYRDIEPPLELLRLKWAYTHTYECLIDLHDRTDGKFYMLSDLQKEEIVQTFLKESDDYYGDILIDLKSDILDFIEEINGKELHSKLMNHTLNQKAIKEMWDWITEWKKTYKEEFLNLRPFRRRK